MVLRVAAKKLANDGVNVRVWISIVGMTRGGSFSPLRRKRHAKLLIDSTSINSDENFGLVSKRNKIAFSPTKGLEDD